MVFGVAGSNDAISGSIKSKMAADGHLGMTALSRVTIASAGHWAFLLRHDVVIPCLSLSGSRRPSNNLLFNQF